MINNVLDAKALPLYGDGKNVRDWLYVQDHVEAIDLLAHRGEMGHT
jgi:dTDP-glucose 4,6-dehydratase